MFCGGGRSLVPYFKKYMLTSVDGDCAEHRQRQRNLSFDQLPEKTRTLLVGEEIEEQQIKTMKKEDLQANVLEHFDGDGNEALDRCDLAILYEITGFQDESPAGDEEFWVNYANYKTLALDQV